MNTAVVGPRAYTGGHDRASTDAGRYQVDLYSSWRSAEARWEAIASRHAALPFQRASWLRHWYDARERHGEGRPLLVFADDRGQPAMALPLIIEQRGNYKTIAFADGGITDYNAPLLGPAAPHTPADARALWKAVARALPACDMVHLEKMPRVIGGHDNPLCHLRVTDAASLTGNILTVPGAWDLWHTGLERTFRKELERSLRVFERHEGARFLRATAPDDVAFVWSALKHQQRARIKELDLPFVLDDSANADFYDALVESEIASGNAVLTALVVGDDVVAALLGVRSGDHYAMVRLATGGPEWRNCSPGRLMIERTMRHLHAQGMRTFDFTIGTYDYKRRFGVEAVALCETRAAMSLRGIAPCMIERVKRTAKRHPRLVALARAWHARQA